MFPTSPAAMKSTRGTGNMLKRLPSIKTPKSPSTLTLNSKVQAIHSASSSPEYLMKTANPSPHQESRHAEKEFEKRNEKLPVSTGSTKVYQSKTTAEFETFEGIPEDQDIEQALLQKGFISTERILTRDDDGNISCQFIKARDNLGHSLYVELDTTCSDGFGYLAVSPSDKLLSVSSEASVIPYSLKVGSFEASTSDLYGVGFECDGQTCIMARKDNSLNPVETVFSVSKNNSEQPFGIQQHHPVPFPIVKMSEILAFPDQVHKNVRSGHARMRNIAFESSMKDVKQMKHHVSELHSEVQKFDELASSISNGLTQTIGQLEEYHRIFENRGIRNPDEAEKMASIRFNLGKRNELLIDYISLCHSMRDRSDKVALLSSEIRDINEYMKALFEGINSVLVE